MTNYRANLTITESGRISLTVSDLSNDREVIVDKAFDMRIDGNLDQADTILDLHELERIGAWTPLSAKVTTAFCRSYMES